MQLLLVRIANAIMGKGAILPLAETDAPLTEKNPWLKTLVDTLKDIVAPALIVVGAAGAVYAIVLGVKMAKADDQSKRDEAKKNLINVLIAVVATILLIILFYAFSGWVDDGTIEFK